MSLEHTTPRSLTPGHIGSRCSFRHLGLAMSGVLMGVEPETAVEHDGAGTDSNVLLGPVSLVLTDGWGITVTVPLPPDHPVTIEDN